MSDTKPNVLVVEDDVVIRSMIARILEHDGFVVETASDGLEAIGKLAHADYSVVVLDMMMPRVDGFGVIDFLHRAKESTLQHVIVLTAACGTRVHDEPVYGVMSKPFDIHHLLERARACSIQRG
jgi:DNA-binding response OmpR family regulator